MNNYRYCFSFVTGEVFRIEKDDIPTLFSYQIPLLNEVKRGCRSCYGRGHTGFESQKGYYIPCKCLGKIIDKENFKAESLSIPRFRQLYK